MDSFATWTDSDPSGAAIDGTDSATLKVAFDDIVRTIETGLSYTNVTISDTLSDSVEYVRPTGAATPEFTYTKGGSSWTEAPAATVDEKGKISWNLGPTVLEKGVTYSIGFKVSLKQSAYDAAAARDGTYTVPTNREATLAYSTMTTVESESTTTEQDPVSYEIPTVQVPVSTLTVSKTWEGAAAPASQLTVQVLQDGNAYKTVILSADNNWGADVKVAAGPKGHTYTVQETDAPSEWTPTYPSSLTLVGLVSQTGSQPIVNTRKTGSLTISKRVSGTIANTNTSYTFVLTSAALAGQSFGGITFSDQGVAEIALKHGESKELSGIPSGTTVTVQETGLSGNAKTSTTVSVDGGDAQTVKAENSTATETSAIDATIPADGAKTLAYVNTSNAVPDTGIDSSYASPLAALLGTAAAGGAVLGAAGLRRRHNR